MANLQELARVAKLQQQIGPQNSDKQLMTLQLRCEFEPFGSASERFELVWVLTFPVIRACWPTEKGGADLFVVDNDSASLTFKGHSESEAIQKAQAFFIWLQNNGIAIPFKQEGLQL